LPWWIASRNILSHKPRAALNVTGIALGVGLIFAVLSLSKTLVTSFGHLYSSVYGKVDLVVSGAGGQGTLKPSVVGAVRSTPGVKVATADIQSVLSVLKNGKASTAQDDQLTIVGLNPNVSDLTARPLSSGQRISARDSIDIDSDFAQRHGLHVGQTVKLATPSGVDSFKIVGLTRPGSDAQSGGQGFASIPLSRARSLFAVSSGYTEIDVQVSSAFGVSAVQQALRHKLPSNVEVASPSQRTSEVNNQLKAFNSILDFFGAMAAFVGAFLILNSFNMTVAQRSREIGVLRTVGASRRQITRSILLEALLLSFLGAPLGLAIGFLFAHLMGLLVEAVNYPIGSVQHPLVAFILAPLAGVAAAVVGALRPALVAGRITPIQAVLAERAAVAPNHRRRLVAGGIAVPFGLWGVYTFAAATALPLKTYVIGVAGIVVLFGGVVIVAPLIVPYLVRVLSRPIRLITPIEGRIAADSTRANPLRTAATASGLMIGVALVATIGSLGASLIGSISDQLNKQLLTDFTVQPANFRQGGSGTTTPTSPAVVQRIASQRDVKLATGVALLLVSNGFKHGDYQALGYDPRVRARVTTLKFIGQTAPAVYAKVARGEVTVGGQLWRRSGVVAGDRISLKGPRQNMKVTVGGVVSGSSLEDQQIGMSLSTFRKLTGIDGYSQIDVLARSNAQRPAVQHELQTLVQHAYPNLTVLSNAGIKDQIETQTNQVFAIFYAIMVVAIIVSLLGVVNTMTISVLERTREIGVLRSIGASRASVGRMVTDESVLLTVAGAAIGLAVGLAIGYFYVHGVSSGLSGISFRPPVTVSIVVAVASVFCGLVAAVLPAQRAAVMNIIEAVSYE
jgi:putative ABC transport system permease protein